MDPFSLLGLPKRPLLTEEEIGSAYRKLAGTLHPDQTGGDAMQFRELGEAAAILRDPSRRLRALAGEIPAASLPSQAADLFPKVAEILQQADSLIEKQQTASNALTKALLTAPMKTLAAELDSLLVQIQSWRSFLDRELLQIDESWPEHDRREMSLLADSFAYAGRWQAQLRERKLTLDSQ